MGTDNKLTKESGRKAMLEMLEQREGKSSGQSNSNTCWAHEFWSRRVVDHAEIKRALGVGTASMSHHLRIYKDPFESSDTRFELLSADANLRTLPANRIQHDVAGSSRMSDGWNLQSHRVSF